jgi:transposase
MQQHVDELYLIDMDKEVVSFDNIKELKRLKLSNIKYMLLKGLDTSHLRTLSIIGYSWEYLIDLPLFLEKCQNV